MVKEQILFICPYAYSGTLALMLRAYQGPKGPIGAFVTIKTRQQISGYRLQSLLPTVNTRISEKVLTVGSML